MERPVTQIRTISPRGIALIKEHEGFRAKPYYCPAGKLTIGYGHVIRDGENFKAITPEEGEALLRNDVAEAESAVSRLVKAPLTQNQFDALVSFVFNIGTNRFAKSTLCSLLNQEMYFAAAQEFQKWAWGGGKKLPGLVKRRAAEKELFLTKE